jgi:thiamine-phosphate pyrophosphorylase
MKSKKNIYTLIDANVNRAKEGLRVIEDVSRFIISDKKISSKLKNIRHDIDSALKIISADHMALLKNRHSDDDAGRHNSNKGEFTRTSTLDIMVSNFKRVEESFRVLEEISKLINPSAALTFKELRYKTYELEKETLI